MWYEKLGIQVQTEMPELLEKERLNSLFKSKEVWEAEDAKDAIMKDRCMDNISENNFTGRRNLMKKIKKNVSIFSIFRLNDDLTYSKEDLQGQLNIANAKLNEAKKEINE